MRRHLLVLSTAAVLGTLIWLIACGGGGGGSTPTPPAMGTVSTSLSDPATCSVSSGGDYVSVFVTITDVQINASASAGDNDPGWIDLTPNLKSAPKQVDLLSTATLTNQCFLAMLGSNTALQAGTYQQIRMILADNTPASVALIGAANNACKNANFVNCVITKTNSTPQELLLSSEAKTGIKIPSGQIAGGNFTIAAGQTKDLNIDFDTCASIVVQGNGQFRLKPVLHGGEVSLTSVSINGKLFDAGSVSKGPIVGGKAIVALELKDTNGVDRIVLPPATADSNGNFNFCPVPMLPTGQSYDVVAVAVNGSNLMYAATITTGVQPGNALGNIPMYPITGTSTLPGSFNGVVSSVNSSNNGTAIDALISLLQTPSGSTTAFTIPAGSQSATLSVTTEKPSTCTTATCPAYTVVYTFDMVPTAAPTMGAFSPSGTPYTASSGTPPGSFVVDGQAFVPQMGNTPDCSPSTMKTTMFNVSPGSSNPVAPILVFTACQ